jgi:predicted acylesterase/phospholipase RssA
MAKQTSVVVVGCGSGLIFEAGALDEFAKSGITYTALQGSSSGAIGSCFLHAGQTKELVDFVQIVKNKDVFKKAPFWWPLGPKAAILDNSPLRATLAKYLNFEKLKREDAKCIIHTTELEFWQDVLNDVSFLSKDDLLDTIVASTSIPLAFAPTKGHVDGGVSNDFPMVAAIEEGTERIIVISGSSSPSGIPKNAKEMLEKLIGSSTFVQRELVFASFAKLATEIEVVSVFPEEPLNISVLGFDQLGDAENRTRLVNLGRKAMLDALAKSK